MRAQYFIAAVAACILFYFDAGAQCTVSGSANNYDDIVCGDCTVLSTSGRGQGIIVFSENFNSGVPTGWETTQSARFDNPCSPNGVDGTIHIWFGNSSGVPRFLQTQSYDFSTATAGV